MATDIERMNHQLGPKIEYLEPRDLPTMHAHGVHTVYVLKEKVIEHHHTGWGFSAFICIGGLALAMLITAFAVVSQL